MATLVNEALIDDLEAVTRVNLSLEIHVIGENLCKIDNLLVARTLFESGNIET